MSRLSLFEDPPGRPLSDIRGELGDCQRCRLADGRRTIVFGSGPQGAKLMFVGEAPGQREDLSGEPFVGRAGELLDELLMFVGLRREDVYITNCVKCRPPGNRNPEQDELDACLPFLDQQILSVQPGVVVALGKFAAQYLLHSAKSISQLRGHMGEHMGHRVLATYHPAFVLRNPAAKRRLIDDLRTAVNFLEVNQ